MRSIPPMQFDTRIERACAVAGNGTERAKTDNVAMMGLIRRLLISRAFLIDQNTHGCPIQIFELPASK